MSAPCTLYREIDALGGSATTDHDRGYVAAIDDVLAILAKRGFSEVADAVPSDCKLVPIEPTQAMMKAGDEQAPFFLGVLRVWSAMLSAAPEQALATRSAPANDAVLSGGDHG